MSITSRDKKIIAAIAALAVVAGFWFLVLGPKRDEASKADANLKKQEQARDAAEQRESTLKAARSRYGADYAAVVKLGKAVPASVDMPSLLVQLDRASKGTGIDFESVKAGERAAAQPTAAPPAGGESGGQSPGGQQGTPAASGGEPAQSTPGKANETAGNKVDEANAASANAEQQSGLNSGDTKTSEAARDGAVPVGGGGPGGTAPAGQPQGSGVPGLDAVPLEFSFQGDFFELADFMHRLKRFVYVANDGIQVKGRLMVIDSFSFKTGDEAGKSSKGGSVQAEVKATVYLSPKQQGASAGATPQGPAQGQPQEASGAPSGAAPATPTPAAPTATVAP